MLNQTTKRFFIAIAILVSFAAGISAKAADNGQFTEGVSCFNQGQYALAASYFKSHISASPSGNAPAYYYLATCYVKMDKMEEAQFFYRHCLELRPDATMAKYCQAALASLAAKPKTTKVASTAGIQ